MFAGNCCLISIQNYSIEAGVAEGRVFCPKDTRFHHVYIYGTRDVSECIKCCVYHVGILGGKGNEHVLCIEHRKNELRTGTREAPVPEGEKR